MYARLLLTLIVLTCLTGIAQAQQTDTTENREEQPRVTQLVGPFTTVEQMPEFPGGKEALQEFISKNLKYPNYALSNRISGEVVTKFIVSKTGEIKDVSVVRGVIKSLDKAAIQLVNKMPKWEPGRQKGEAVDVWFTLPLRFVCVDSENRTDEAGDSMKSDAQANLPLYIIDGKESTRDEFKAIDKSKIKSYIFVVAEKAKKRYGEKAKNGAIEIELK